MSKLTKEQALGEFLHSKDLERFYCGSRERAWCRKFYKTLCDAYNINTQRGKFPTVQQFCEYTDFDHETAIKRFGF